MRATAVRPQGDWQPADTITLDYHHRHRRRIRLRTDGGADLLLDLAETTHLRDGDGLDCGDDGIVRVIAATEPLAEITGDPDLLVRLAWHLGNRHLDVAFRGTALLIRSDHVIEAMVTGLGGTITHSEAAFDPESGAYAHDHG
ncbi:MULTISPECIES: urease accessory protein UreE [Acidiphilium]|uniref:Urease accessory protein UreE n=1 Tax=Acidiphilium rubrum TaxID=526 RepID=A0A8G2CMN0_ACIRU|nr:MULTISPECIES: urease accessory protein UreE [Acidiphilium]MCW8305794.1 urease accessory protein UreE [Acidiphilium sp. PA]SIR27088.1 urease accessory protein [Acidiphilium rubrum]